jgi:hypothetical protein
MPINLAALSVTSGVSSGGGDGMAASSSGSIEGRRDTGLEEGRLDEDSGLRDDLLLGGG